MIEREMGMNMAPGALSIMAMETEGIEVFRNLEGLEPFVYEAMESLASDPEKPIIFVLMALSATGKDAVEDQIRQVVENDALFQSWAQTLGYPKVSVYSINIPSANLAAQVKGDLEKPLRDGNPVVELMPPRNPEEFKIVAKVVKEAITYGLNSLSGPRFLLFQLPAPTAHITPEGLKLINDRGESVVDWMANDPDLRSLVRLVFITNEGRSEESREQDLRLREQTENLTPNNVIRKLKEVGIIPHFKGILEVEADKAAGKRETYSKAQREWLVRVFPQLRAPGTRARRMLAEQKEVVERLYKEDVIKSPTEQDYYEHLMQGWKLEEQSLITPNPDLKQEKGKKREIHYYFEGRVEDNNLLALMYPEVREILQPPLS